MNTGGKKKAGSWALCLAAVALTLLVVEICARSVFFQQYASQSCGIMYAYRGLQRIAAEKIRLRDFQSGMRLNREAWTATFAERGLPVPPAGPREGFWGSRVTPKQKCRILRYCEPAISLPGLLEIDRLGFQHAGSTDGGVPHILIVGGSVAFGAYASSIRETYFEKVAGLLARQSLPVRISVLAAGGWVSLDELLAMALRGLPARPDVVVLLNGLNDLTEDAVQQQVDYDALVKRYLENMQAARDMVLSGGTMTLVYALQPFPGTKERKSPLERRILELSYGSRLNRFYDQMRTGLQALADNDRVVLADCSDVFSREPHTTFVDQFHFSDPGHTLLARSLARRLEPIVKRMYAERKD